MGRKTKTGKKIIERPDNSALRRVGWNSWMSSFRPGKASSSDPKP